MTEINTFGAFKDRAAKVLASISRPTKRDENWRHSDLTLIDKCDNSVHSNALPMSEVIDSLNKAHYNIVLVDGKLQKELTDTPSEAVKLYGVHDQGFLDKLPKTDLKKGFESKYQVLQNYSKIEHCILIEISQTLDKPLKILYVYTGKSAQSNIFIKLCDKLGVKLYEEFIQVKESECYLNYVSTIHIGEGASCQHFKSHEFVGEVSCLYTSKVICDKSAEYNHYVVNYGYKSYRQEIECYLRGDNASSNFYGVTIGKAQEIYDVIIKAIHQSSHTKSMQHYNQIFSGKSQGSFYTKVKIPKSLSAIEAHQLNKNMLLNIGAKVFSRPELDINSDDVICSHGATVGKISEDAIYYLTSRGIDKKTAEELIIQGFLYDVFDIKSLDQKDHKNLIKKSIGNISTDVL
jgi:Fe-S cluster assembly protein SufD